MAIGRRLETLIGLKIRPRHFLCCLSALAWLAACGPAPDDGAVRLSGWISGPAEDQFMQQAVDQFQQSHPDATVHYHPIQANYPEKIQLMLGTGTAPDLFMLEGVWAPAFTDFGLLAPLDDYIAQDPDFALEDIEPRLLEAFTFNGRLYGLPKDYSTLALFYNPDMLARAGIQAPPGNWQELADMAARLTRDVNGDGVTDQYGFGIGLTLDFVLPFIWQNGGELMRADGRPGLDDPRLVEALHFLQDMRRQGILGLPSDVGAAWNMDGFGRQGFAMTISGRWAVNFLAGAFPATPYRIAVLPAGRTRATVAFAVGYVMPARQTIAPGTWALMRFLTDRQGQMAWAQTGTGLPTRRAVVRDLGWHTHADKAAFIESMAWARLWQFGTHAHLIKEAETMLQRVFLLDEPVETALARMAHRLHSKADG